MISPRSISPASPTASDHVGATRVLPWKGGARGAFLLQFDDSAPSHLDYAIPALLHRGIPGTFFVNPGTGPYKSRRTDWKKAAALPGIELASHSYLHVGAVDEDAFEKDLVLANSEIDRLYPSRPADRVRIWARPVGPEVDWKIDESSVKKILARHQMVERAPFRNVPASVSEMRKRVDEALDSSEPEQLIFHGIGADWDPTPLGYFITLLDLLIEHAHLLWITDSVSAYRYAMLRDSTRVTLLAAAAGCRRMTLETGQASCPCAEPLTLATKLYSRSDSPIIHQGGRALSYWIRNDEVVYEAVPGAGDIVIHD